MAFPDPGYVGDVSAGGTIDPAWGNAIRDRLVHRFANTAARDASITAPKEGMVCWLADVDQFLVYNGFAWRLPWNAPWGQVAFAQITATQAGMSTLADVTGLAATWVAVANRLYEVRASAGLIVAASGTPGLTKVLITTSAGTAVAAVVNAVLTGSGSGSRTAGERGVELSGLAAGSTTYKVQASCASGTIDFNANGNDPGPSWISVRDLGPNGTAA